MMGFASVQLSSQKVSSSHEQQHIAAAVVSSTVTDACAQGAKQTIQLKGGQGDLTFSATFDAAVLDGLKATQVTLL